MNANALINRLDSAIAETDKALDLISAAIQQAEQGKNESLREAYCPGVENAWALEDNARAWEAELHRLTDALNEVFAEQAMMRMARNAVTGLNIRLP